MSLKRLTILMILLGALVGLAGCSWLIEPGEEPTPPDNPPPEPQPEPVLGILMEGEPLPECWWPPLEYGHFWEGQYVEFSLVAENIEVELCEWWVWPDDRPDVKRHYEGKSFRDYFIGWLCYQDQSGPRPFTVLCRVTDSAGKLHDLWEKFWIHQLSG